MGEKTVMKHDYFSAFKSFKMPYEGILGTKSKYRWWYIKAVLIKTRNQVRILLTTVLIQHCFDGSR